MKKHLSTIILSVVLLVCLVGLGVVIFAFIPKDCQHHSCDKTPHEPTCDIKGYTYYVCRDCGYSFEADFIAPLGHKFTSTVVAPTCDTEGYTSHYCSVCGINDKDNYKRPTGHDFKETLHAPTCEDLGYTHYECKSCSFAMDSDYVQPTGHSYTKKFVHPTVEKSFDSNNQLQYNWTTGYTEYTCETCKSTHIGDYYFYSDVFSGAAGEGKGDLAWGVDLSHHSENVNFKSLKDAGVDFVILRVGYGKTLDTKFEEYYKSAKEAGLDVGVYFFTLSETAKEAEEDALRISEWLKGKQLEYPVFFDVEDDTHYSGYLPSQFSKEKLMDIIGSFMTKMISLDYYPGLYTNNKFLTKLFHTESTLCMYDVWYARYPEDRNNVDEFTKKYMNEYSQTYSMWQYIDSVDKFHNGAVSGMCDLNYAFKDYPSIMKEFGFNGYQ